MYHPVSPGVIMYHQVLSPGVVTRCHLEDVEQARHLREDEDAVAAREELLEELVEIAGSYFLVVKT